MATLQSYTGLANLQSARQYTLSRLLVANTPADFTVPTDQNGILATFVELASAGDYYAECFDSVSGADKVTNGTFTTDTDWTKGTGWTIGAGVATASTASTALSQSAATLIVEGQAYLVTMTITASAGTLTPSVGGTAGTARNSTGTYSEVIIAGSTQVLAFTGAGFSGTVDAVTVTACATVPGNNATGEAAKYKPAGFYLNGTITRVSVVSASTPIVTASFYNGKTYGW